MMDSLSDIDALHAESSALLAQANALRASSRAEADTRRALAMYGRAAELAAECQRRLLARLNLSSPRAQPMIR